MFENVLTLTFCCGHEMSWGKNPLQLLSRSPPMTVPHPAAQFHTPMSFGKLMLLPGYSTCIQFSKKMQCMSEQDNHGKPPEIFWNQLKEQWTQAVSSILLPQSRHISEHKPWPGRDLRCFRHWRTTWISTNLRWWFCQFFCWIKLSFHNLYGECFDSTLKPQEVCVRVIFVSKRWVHTMVAPRNHCDMLRYASRMVHRRIESMNLDMPEKKGGIWWDAESFASDFQGRKSASLGLQQAKGSRQKHLFLARRTSRLV